MTAIRVIALFTLRESLRRRVFAVVAILTVVFLALYGLGLWRLYAELDRNELDGTGVEIAIVAGATVLGLAMFATLFLGTVLAVFLTLGAVRGDAERGLLQPLLVRPVSRRDLLLGRYVGGGGRLRRSTSPASSSPPRSSPGRSADGGPTVCSARRSR